MSKKSSENIKRYFYNFLVAVISFAVIFSLSIVFMLFVIGGQLAGSSGKEMTDFQIYAIVIISILFSGGISFWITRYTDKTMLKREKKKGQFDHFWTDQGKDLPSDE